MHINKLCQINDQCHFHTQQLVCYSTTKFSESLFFFFSFGPNWLASRCRCSKTISASFRFVRRLSWGAVLFRRLQREKEKLVKFHITLIQITFQTKPTTFDAAAFPCARPELCVFTHNHQSDHCSISHSDFFFRFFDLMSPLWGHSQCNLTPLECYITLKLKCHPACVGVDVIFPLPCCCLAH